MPVGGGSEPWRATACRPAMPKAAVLAIAIIMNIAVAMATAIVVTIAMGCNRIAMAMLFCLIAVSVQ